MGGTSTIGRSTTATHSPDQTLTSPLPPGCLLSAPHRLTPPDSQLRPRHAHSRSTWVHCQGIHAHLHHLAPCTPRAPLFSAYSVARPCGVCFAKSDSYLSILPVTLRHGGLICSLGDFKTSGRGGFLTPPLYPYHACVSMCMRVCSLPGGDNPPTSSSPIKGRVPVFLSALHVVNPPGHY